MQTHCSPIKLIPVSMSNILNRKANSSLKRSVTKSSNSVAEIGRQKTVVQNKFRKVESPAPTVSTTPPKMYSANKDGNNSQNSTTSSSAIQQQQQQQQQNNNLVMINSAAAMAAKFLNLNGSGSMLEVQGTSTAVSIPKTKSGITKLGIINLAEDNGAVVTGSNSLGKKAVHPATQSSTAAASLMMNVRKNANSVKTFQSGVEYRLVSQGPGSKYKLVQKDKNYHVVTSGDQNWSISVSLVESEPQMRTTMRPAAEENIALRRSLAPGSQAIEGEPIMILAAGETIIRPVFASTAVKQHAKNDVNPMMVHQQQSQHQPINSTFKVPIILSKKQREQGATQVKAIKAETKDHIRLQTVCPMGQALNVNTKAVGDVVKKFVLPPLPPPAIVVAPKRSSKDIPPRPDLRVTAQERGIVLSWALQKLGPNHAEIQTYQVFVCQEPLFTNPKSRSWTKVGDVKALPLPMACTLSKFRVANRYHFIVRGVDVYNRTGPFCAAAVITVNKK